MDKEILKEKIKNYIEIRKNLWTAMLGLTGGVTALSIALDNPAKIGFAITGAIFLTLTIISIKLTNEEINRVIKQMEKIRKND